MTNKRITPRQKSFLRGFVYFGNSPSAVDCVVRDISETGARLKFQSPPAIVDTVSLHIPIKGQTFQAKVRWHESDEIGVAFINAPAQASLHTADDDLSDRVNRLEAEIAGLKQLVKRLQQNIPGKIEAA